MADLAVVFHWAPADMNQLGLQELMDWRGRAVELHNQINAPPEK